MRTVFVSIWKTPLVEQKTYRVDVWFHSGWLLSVRPPRQHIFFSTARISPLVTLCLCVCPPQLPFNLPAQHVRMPASAPSVTEKVFEDKVKIVKANG